MRRLFAVVLPVVVLFSGCTSGDFKLIDKNGTGSLTIAKGSSGTRNFTLQAEGHYLNTTFDVTGSASDTGVTATPSATSVNTGSSGSVDVSLEVSIPADFAGTSTTASIRLQDTRDPESFARSSFTVVVE